MKPAAHQLPSRVVLDVNLKKIIKNYKTIMAKVKPAKVMAVLKANAYGLGAERVAEALLSAGVDRLAVAEIKEAAVLKKLTQASVHILGELLHDEIVDAVRLDLVCPIQSLETAKLLSREAVRQNKNIRVHFKIDSGMGRLGFPIRTAEENVRKVLTLPNLIAEGIYSHFPSANLVKEKTTEKQIEQFKQLLEKLSDVPFAFCHLANSDGINNFPTSYFDLVRTGINLYGVFDLSGRHAYDLEASLTLKTKLIAKRLLPKGHGIGYGGTHVLKKETWVGTIPAGYADGLPLALSNRGKVLVGGAACPVIGRVSMDYTTIDLSAAKTSRVGDEVILIGKSKKNPKLEITVENWAKLKGTHPYEIICSFGGRVFRNYLF